MLLGIYSDELKTMSYKPHTDVMAVLSIVAKLGSNPNVLQEVNA